MSEKIEIVYGAKRFVAYMFIALLALSLIAIFPLSKNFWIKNSSNTPLATVERADELIQLFHVARRPIYDGPQFAMVPDAETYIKSHASSIDEAIALLKASGFRDFYYTNDPARVAILNQSYLKSHGETYQSFISARRWCGSFWPFPWAFATTYSVTLLIKENRVSDVTARVDLTLI